MLIVIITLNGIKDVEAGNVILPNTTITSFSQYENKTLGIRIQYPANWTVNEYGNYVEFYNRTDPMLYQLGISRYSSSYVPMEEEAAAWINYYKQNLTNFTVIDSVSTTLGNASAYKIISSYYDVENKIEQKDLEFLAIKGDNVYHIVYSAEIGAYDKWLNTAKHMIESLELSDTSSTISSYDAPIPSDGSTTFTEPVGISVNLQTNMIYTLNYYFDTIDISTIDNLGLRLLDQIPIREPFGLTVDTYEHPLDGLAFVTSKLDDAISVINGSSNEVISNITVGNQPNEISVNPITNRIYVASSGDGDPSSYSNQTIPAVYVIDYWISYANPAVPFFNHRLIDSILVDKFVKDISINPQTNMIYVSKHSSDTISVINGSSNEVTSNIQVGKQPNEIAVNPQRNMIYVSKHSSDTISVINGSSNEVTSNIQVDPFPRDIVVNPITNRVYVASSGYNSTISTIDGLTHKVTDKISIADPVAIDIDPDDGFLYVKHDYYSDLSVLNTFSNKVFEDVRNKRDISFYTAPESGGEIYCYGEGKIYDSESDNYINFVTFHNGTEVNCSAYPKRGFLFTQWIIDDYVFPNSTEFLSLRLTNQTTIAAEFNEVIPTTYLMGLVALAVVCIAIHLIHWRLILIREKTAVKKYIRRIRAIAELSGQDNEKSLEQLIEIRDEISKLLKGKISEERYKQVEGLISEYMNKIRG